MEKFLPVKWTNGELAYGYQSREDHSDSEDPRE
jgi:hypothetical protein